MASSRGFGRRGKNRLADMSLPPGDRLPPKRRKASKRKRAQMDHASNAAARKKAREGEQKMERTR